MATAREPGEDGISSIQISDGIHCGSEIVVHYRAREIQRQDNPMVTTQPQLIFEPEKGE